MSKVYKHSRMRHGWLLVVCLLFAAIAVWQLSTKETGSIMDWLALVLFGGGAVLYLFDLFNPDTRFLIPGSEAEKAYLRTTKGSYQYRPEGFTVTTDDGYEDKARTYRVAWQEITHITLKKTRFKDRYRDVVVEGLAIRGQNQVFETNETKEGYFVLVEQIKANVKEISQDWQLDEPAAVHQQTEKTLWRKGGNKG